MTGDEARLAAHFDRALRSRGVQAGTRRALTFAEVLRVLPPDSAESMYWRARAAMLPSIDDLSAFQASFFEVFAPADNAGVLRSLIDRADPPARSETGAPKHETPPPPSERPADPGSAERAPIQLVLASNDERLTDAAFDELDENERAAMLRLIERVRAAAELRETRRRRAHPYGDRFDFRGTLRGAARTAGELMHRRTTRRRLRVRPLIFLLDVSGSMAPFARPLVQYARVTAGARAAVRAFAFATRLTDLTPLLAGGGTDRLMRALGEAVSDYGGGTRIGASLREFNDRFAVRGTARGGTVVILSDGWEREDPALVGSEMERLRRLTRRIVWVNPHKRHAAYEPLARGMAAALPYLDAFVSGHSLRTLEAVADAIEGRPR